MDQYTYTQLHQAADLLWPGEATQVLDNPTDEQIAMIVAVLNARHVATWMSTENSICYSAASVL